MNYFPERLLVCQEFKAGKYKEGVDMAETVSAGLPPGPPTSLLGGSVASYDRL